MVLQIYQVSTKQLTDHDWKNFSDFLNEGRKLAIFNGGITKLKLRPSVLDEVSDTFSTFEDNSEKSFFRKFGDLSMASYATQHAFNVSKFDERKKHDGVYGVSNAHVETPGWKVKDFYNYAREERSFAHFDYPEPGIITDVEEGRSMYSKMWNMIDAGWTETKPFLYGLDIFSMPAGPVGPVADMGTAQVGTCI